jgi:V8-like Glu-specific endopeptidase
LPSRYWDRQKKLDLATPVNFVSTCDIIGGNSGSPTLNKNGEFIGIVFDGNIESLPGNFVYDIRNNRAVSVDSRYILEALNKLYDTEKLVKELGN